MSGGRSEVNLVWNFDRIDTIYIVNRWSLNLTNKYIHHLSSIAANLYVLPISALGEVVCFRGYGAGNDYRYWEE
jgi:hypothetical protein